MKLKYFLPALLLIAGCGRDHSRITPDLSYELSYFREGRIHVKLVYKPIEKGSTLFTYGEPRFGGQSDIVKGFTGLKAQEGVRVNFDDFSRELTLFCRDTLPVTVDYDIVDTRMKEHGLRGELFRPIIMNDYLYCHGINLFLNPVLRDPKQKVTQSVVWKKLPPFRLFQQFDPENHGSRPSVGKPEDFMYKLITGADGMITEKVKAAGSENYLVLRLVRNSDFNRKALSGYFKSYYEAICGFWKEESPQPYFLILQPFLSIDHNIGGMGLGNGFAGKYSYNTDTILSPERIFTISHEIGHHWIGGLIESGVNDQWFAEGFNDYFTWYTLLSAGMMTPSQFERSFNNVLVSHYSSKVKELPNDSIWPNYWKMGDYNKLPYRRGSIFAFYLDNQIRRVSNGEKNLHDLMLSLKEFRQKMDPGYQLSISDFASQASAFVPADSIKTELARYITSGVPVRFSTGMLTDAFSVSWKDSIPVLQIRDNEKFESFFRK